MEWKDGRTPDPDKICTARKTDGTPCRKQRVLGAMVCATHGGKAPQVKDKARVRLSMAADKLARELLKIAIDDDEVPAAVKLAAVKSALDRVGLSEKHALEVEVAATKPFEELLTDMIVGGSRAESRAHRTGEGPEGSVPEWLAEELDIVEAEVVDESEEHEPLIPRERPAPQPPVAGDFVTMEDGLETLRPHQPAPPRPRRPWGRK